MKRIIATLLCALFLVSSFALTASAAGESDIQFSMKGAEGSPGDIVNVEVYLDKNVGTWACYFEVRFNERYFTLLSIDNGDVYSDGEFVKSILTNRGKYIYYAEGSDPDRNNTNTGLILTLTFEITENAPVGATEMTLFFPDDGKGWFFDGSEFPDFVTEYTVSCSNSAVINILEKTVIDDPVDTPDTTPDSTPDTSVPDTDKVDDPVGSDVPDTDKVDGPADSDAPDTDKVDGPADSDDPDTDKVDGPADSDAPDADTTTPDTGNKDTDSGFESDSETLPPETELPGIPVTDYVSDDSGIVTDKEGEPVVSQKVDENGDPLYYETDIEGGIVTDEKGEGVTIAVPESTAPIEDTTASPEEETTASPEEDTTASPETTVAGDSDSTTTADTDASKEEPDKTPYKMILIASIAAVIVGAIIVTIVMTRPKKKD